jgi:hypothetical protein
VGLSYIHSKNATFSDWAGSYKGISIGYLLGSVQFGKSSAYTVWGLGFGPSLGPKKFQGVSASGQIGVTTLLGAPYYKPFDHGTSPYSNTYFNELYGL